MWHISGAPTGRFLCIQPRTEHAINTERTWSKFLSGCGHVACFYHRRIQAQGCFDTWLYFISILLKPLLLYCLQNKAGNILHFSDFSQNQRPLDASQHIPTSQIRGWHSAFGPFIRRSQYVNEKVSVVFLKQLGTVTSANFFKQEEIVHSSGTGFGFMHIPFASECLWLQDSVGVIKINLYCVCEIMVIKEHLMECVSAAHWFLHISQDL